MKQHACTSSDLRDHYSKLLTWMATVKLYAKQKQLGAVKKGALPSKVEALV